MRNATKLPLTLKLLYGIGSISDSIKSLAFGLFLLFYYTSVRGVPGTMVGSVLSLSLLWDAAIDPLIGSLSDRLPKRVGRRHAPMLAGSLVMGVAFFAIFSPPAGLSREALLVWLIGFNLLLRTAQSAFTVPYWALGAELTGDYHERTSLTGVRTACALTGTMATATLSFLLFFPDSRFEASNYASMGAALGCVLTGASLITVFGTWSWRDRCDSTGQSTQQLSLAAGFRSALRSPSFRVMALSSGLFFMAAILNATVAIHYLTYYAGLTGNRSTSLFQGAFYVVALAGVGVWVVLTRRFEKHHVYTIATFGTAAIMTLGYLLVGENSLFGKGNLAAMAIGHGLAGFFASAVWVLPSSMMADVLEEQQWLTGRRAEGSLFGLHSLALQLGASLAVVLSGFLLDHYAGLTPGVEQQSASTSQRIGVLYGLVPAVLLAVAGVLSMFYRLDHRRVVELQAMNS